MGDDGFPVIIPVIQCQAADSTRLAFSTSAYGDELARISKGSRVAIFGMTLQMEDVLVRGKYNGIEKHLGVSLGTVDIEWVYNSMPPIQGQIYPATQLAAVTEF